MKGKIILSHTLQCKNFRISVNNFKGGLLCFCLCSLFFFFCKHDFDVVYSKGHFKPFTEIEGEFEKPVKCIKPKSRRGNKPKKREQALNMRLYVLLLLFVSVKFSLFGLREAVTFS